MNQIFSGLVGWRRLAAAALILSLAGSAGLLPGSDHGQAAAATKYSAWVATGGRGIAVEVFVPSVVMINVGDTVEWTNPYLEGHTLSFLADKPVPANTRAPVGNAVTSFDGSAQISSGAMSQGQTYTVTFTKQGFYQFVCLIHTAQKGEVQVLAEGVHVPDQKQRDFDMAQYSASAIAKGIAAKALVNLPVKSANANGTATWNVPSSPALQVNNGTIDVMEFLPSNLKIGLADTVTWQNDTTTPHTITFTAGGPPGDSRTIVKPPTLGYDGSSYVSSGFMGTRDDFTGGTRFSLTFTKAGTYSYICILHASQGMAGVIEVGSGGISPPSTGDAGLAPD